MNRRDFLALLGSLPIISLAPGLEAAEQVLPAQVLESFPSEPDVIPLTRGLWLDAADTLIRLDYIAAVHRPTLIDATMLLSTAPTYVFDPGRRLELDLKTRDHAAQRLHDAFDESRAMRMAFVIAVPGAGTTRFEVEGGVISSMAMHVGIGDEIEYRLQVYATHLICLDPTALM